ncbi:MAG TPA: ATP-binding protein [Longimicrobiales bacterium]|nr:ATP-binding protein [Longimicrobiales bacterium]
MRNEQKRDGLASLLLERIRDHAMIALDDAGVVTEWNTGATRLLGWDERQAVGRSIRELLAEDPGAQERKQSALEAARAAGEFEFEGWHPRADGTRIWTHTQILRYAPERGGAGFAILLRDLTERRRTQEQLEEHGRRLDEAQRVARLGSWSWDVDTGKLQWSPALYDVYGVDPDGFTPSYDAFLERLLPEERTRVTAAVEHALQTAGAFQWEERIQRPDGAVCVLQTHGRAVTRNGRVVRLVGTCQDVTEQRAAAERERQLLREQAAREAAESMLEEKGALLAELRASHEQLEQQAIELEAQADELIQLMSELEERNRELHAANDALHASNAAAEQARRVAEEANAAKSQFLAAMSHELRTPLNAIAGHAQLLQLEIHGPMTEAQLQALERIQRSGHHLLALINDILNFAKLEAGSVRFAARDVDLPSAVQEIVTLLTPQLNARRLHCVIPPSLAAAHAFADPDKLDQILMNLLSNAIKFTPEGGRITIECEVDSTSTRVHVTDTGAGVPEERIEEIFEPFVQLRPDASTLTDGVGLGLSISRALARGMRGDLLASNVPTGGARFTLVLPAAAGVLSAQAVVRS